MDKKRNKRELLEEENRRLRALTSLLISYRNDRVKDGTWYGGFGNYETDNLEKGLYAIKKFYDSLPKHYEKIKYELIY